ncbi:hypothetical protein [Streptomyces sulphureus]|uniref:hypothetical protein n=1 Tax=Streptomyces sulphureus TaxID=47758 RepID=UPI0003A7B062|nr:hypothetical protein [Streptomyces sulphureus]
MNDAPLSTAVGPRRYPAAHPETSAEPDDTTGLVATRAPRRRTAAHACPSPTEETP